MFIFFSFLALLDLLLDTQFAVPLCADSTVTRYAQRRFQCVLCVLLMSVPTAVFFLCATDLYLAYFFF